MKAAQLNLPLSLIRTQQLGSRGLVIEMHGVRLVARRFAPSTTLVLSFGIGTDHLERYPLRQVASAMGGTNGRRCGGQRRGARSVPAGKEVIMVAAVSQGCSS
jgi:hypothetical protein